MSTKNDLSDMLERKEIDSDDRIFWKCFASDNEEEVTLTNEILSKLSVLIMIVLLYLDDRFPFSWKELEETLLNEKFFGFTPNRNSEKSSLLKSF